MQKGIKTPLRATCVPFFRYDPTAEMQKGIKTLLSLSRAYKLCPSFYDPTAEMQKGIKTQTPEKLLFQVLPMTRPQKCKRGLRPFGNFSIKSSLER